MLKAPEERLDPGDALFARVADLARRGALEERVGLRPEPCGLTLADPLQVAEGRSQARVVQVRVQGGEARLLFQGLEPGHATGRVVSSPSHGRRLGTHGRGIGSPRRNAVWSVWEGLVEIGRVGDAFIATQYRPSGRGSNIKPFVAAGG